MSAVDLERELDENRWVKMAIHYRRLRIDNPTLNRAIAARNAGAIAFGVSVDELLSPSRTQPLTMRRMKIIAASTLLTDSTPEQIARAFHRSRQHINRACERYRGRARVALAKLKVAA